MRQVRKVLQMAGLVSLAVLASAASIPRDSGDSGHDRSSPTVGSSTSLAPMNDWFDGHLTSPDWGRRVRTVVPWLRTRSRAL